MWRRRPRRLGRAPQGGGAWRHYNKDVSTPEVTQPSTPDTRWSQFKTWRRIVVLSFLGMFLTYLVIFAIALSMPYGEARSSNDLIVILAVGTFISLWGSALFSGLRVSRWRCP